MLLFRKWFQQQLSVRHTASSEMNSAVKLFKAKAPGEDFGQVQWCIFAIEFCWAGNSLFHSEFVFIQSIWTWLSSCFFPLPTFLWLLPEEELCKHRLGLCSASRSFYFRLASHVVKAQQPRWHKHNGSSSVWNSSQASSLTCRFPWQWRRRWDQCFS